MAPRKSSGNGKTKSVKAPSKTSSGSRIRALEEKLTQREAELAVINRIQVALAAKLNFQEIIDEVGDKLSEIFPDGNVGFALLDKAREIITFPYVIENGKRIDYFELALAQSGLMQHILKRRRPVIINSKFAERFEGIGTFNYPGRDQRDLKSWVSVPIFNGDEIIGGASLRSWEHENAFAESDIRLLQTVANTMSVALDNARLLKETEQRATELQIINNIGQTLTEGLDLLSTIERVGDRLREVLDVKDFGIIIFDEKIEKAVAKYVYRNGKRAPDELLSVGNIRLNMRLSARGKGRAWVVNRNAEKSWQKFGGITDGDIPKSYAKLPLVAGGKLIGGITLADYEKEMAFTSISIGMLETIASNLGTAIQNTRLFDETQRLLKETVQRATELQIINNIGQTLTEGGDLVSTIQRVGDRLREALKVENIGFSVWDEKLEHIVAKYYYRNGKPASSETWMAGDVKMALRLAARGGGRSWVVNRNAEKSWRKFGGVNEVDAPKSFVQLPLLAGGKLVGGITIADYEKEDAFTDLSVGMLETISSNMGTAIQNARLFDETQHLLKETEQRATELQIINNIGQTLTEGGDLESMIQRVGERIQEALNINNVAISIFDKETDHVIAPYMVRNGEQIKLTEDNFNLKRYKMFIRAWARAGGRGTSWAIIKDVDKVWRKSWRGTVADDVPKSLVALPLLAGGEIIGGISLADYEREEAFADISTGMLEIIAANMGTAIQNVRLFDETKRLFAEAEEARASAEQANKAKSTFLANMSHELRTPLNAIMGFTQIVRAKAEGVLPEKQLGNLDKVLSSSEHLLGLINTALDIAKIEAGRMDVLPSKFNLSALADQCANLATPLLKPNITLEKQVDETIGTIYSDQDKIKQIALNLLSNAAKFTHNGRILLGVTKLDEENVNISVTDSGIGISKEALGRVFEEFQQADNTTTRQYGGTGLGLAISRNLARLLGGDLTATSEQGKGSTFTLTIPMQYKPNASIGAKPDPVHSAEPNASIENLQP